ncbi:pentatricopeptide repeat-containing protein At2g02750 [Vigna umbellata]|uniref:pentatricopeptide repeat-containing protein At2g02750 n=1 Tax=Vigna umbellata TaxID=87088 RepID=UPI001F5E8FB2|nr:pentatricopeptide repeat-containing protein At2g02750 [Vigna umbellata]XP_047172865.1 pentatricopeptide repeat-containing protein At2g02750 [Vigna umbellata]
MRRDNISLRKLVADGFYKEALSFFSHLHSSSSSPTLHSFTFPTLFKACAKLRLPSHTQTLHAHLHKTGFHADPYATSALTAAYSATPRHFPDALKVFDEMPQPNVASLNAALSGFSLNGRSGEAIRVFQRIGLGPLRPNSVTIACMLGVPHVGVDHVALVHCCALKLGVEFDVYVATSLVTAYSKCEELVSATKVLEELPVKSVVSYNAFITGLLRNGVLHLVLDVFREMMREVRLDCKLNSVTLVSVLSACGSLQSVRLGMQVHGLIVKLEVDDGVMVVTALVDMYSKCGFWHSAYDVFTGAEGDSRNLITWNSMVAGMMLNKESERAVDMFRRLESEELKPDSATWNSMINGFAQQGVCGEAFKYFREMQSVGVAPCLKIVTTILSTCADSSMLRHGKEIHGFALRTDINRDDFLATALVDMYMKCGHASWAREVFNQFDTKPDDPAFWNAMIGGYGRNGDHESAFEIFNKMLEESVRPNSATFVCVLSACSHTGQVDRGLTVFRMMIKDYGLQPKPEHFGCIVDLLGRFGKLGEARGLVQELAEPPASVLASLLGACRCYLDSSLGEEMAMRLLDIEPENPTPLVILSNIYAGLGRWKEVERVRGMITDKGSDKLSGLSMTEVASK